MALRILASNVNGVNGHITHLVRIEESHAPGQTSFGPEETIGIWPEALLTSYHPAATPVSDQSVAAAHQKWLAHHHNRMTSRKRHLDAMARVAHGLKGKLMFGEEGVD